MIIREYKKWKRKKNEEDREASITSDLMDHYQKISEYIKQDKLEELRSYIDSRIGYNKKSIAILCREALSIAAWHGKLDILKYLLQRNIKGKILKNNWDDEWTPLTIATLRGHAKIVNYLLMNEQEGDSHKDKLWHLAAFGGYPEVMKCLHEAKVTNINSEYREEKRGKYREGYTPLTLAACFGHAAAVQCLLELKANIQNAKKGTPFLIAAQNGHVEVMDILFNKNPELLNMKNEENGWTPLMAAAWKGQSNSVDSLVDRKADKECKSTKEFQGIQRNSTALDIARDPTMRKTAILKKLDPGFIDPDVVHSERSKKEQLAFKEGVRKKKNSRKPFNSHDKKSSDSSKKTNADADVILINILPTDSKEFKDAMNLIRKIGNKGEQYIYHTLKSEYQKRPDCKKFKGNKFDKYKLAFMSNNPPGEGQFCIKSGKNNSLDYLIGLDGQKTLSGNIEQRELKEQLGDHQYKEFSRVLKAEELPELQLFLIDILMITAKRNNTPPDNEFTAILQDGTEIKLEWFNHPKESYKPYDMELIICKNGQLIERRFIEIKSSSRSRETQANAYFSQNEWRKMLAINQKKEVSLLLEDELYSEIEKQTHPHQKKESIEELCKKFIRLGIEAEKSKNQKSMLSTEASEKKSLESKAKAPSSFKENSSYTVYFVKGCGKKSEPSDREYAEICKFDPQDNASFTEIEKKVRNVKVVPFFGKFKPIPGPVLSSPAPQAKKIQQAPRPQDASLESSVGADKKGDMVEELTVVDLSPSTDQSSDQSPSDEEVFPLPSKSEKSVPATPPNERTSANMLSKLQTPKAQPKSNNSDKSSPSMSVHSSAEKKLILVDLTQDLEDLQLSSPTKRNNLSKSSNNLPATPPVTQLQKRPRTTPFHVPQSVAAKMSSSSSSLPSSNSSSTTSVCKLGELSALPVQSESGLLSSYSTSSSSSSILSRDDSHSPRQVAARKSLAAALGSSNSSLPVQRRWREKCNGSAAERGMDKSSEVKIVVASAASPLTKTFAMTTKALMNAAKAGGSNQKTPEKKAGDSAAVAAAEIPIYQAMQKYRNPAFGQHRSSQGVPAGSKSKVPAAGRGREPR